LREKRPKTILFIPITSLNANIWIAKKVI